MKHTTKILWGVVLVAVGVIIGLNALDIADIELFFDGWWTLFIIVPCGIGLFGKESKTGNLIGLLIGVVLLLACNDIINFGLVWKLLLPVIIIIIGLRLIFKDMFNKGAREAAQKFKESGTEGKQYCATFSGVDADYTNRVFDGAELTAIFGGVKCDLRNAIIDSDVVINVCSVFGGIDIFLPDNVNVQVSSTSIFGGISNAKRVPVEGGHTVYINGTCIFGGTDVK